MRLSQSVAIIAVIAMGSLAAVAQTDEFKGDPYPLDVCAVSGEKLGSMGEPILHVHEGRQIKFCCAGCKPRFNGDPAMYLTDIDAQIIEDQIDVYPLDVDLVTGEGLNAKGSPVDIVYYNRLVRFASSNGANKFYRNPEEHLAKLDEAVIAKQLDSYPLDECPICGQAVGEGKDDAQNLIVANRLIRLGCAGCDAEILADPAKYLALLDADKSSEAKTKDSHQE